MGRKDAWKTSSVAVRLAGGKCDIATGDKPDCYAKWCSILYQVPDWDR
jgi:hypothetical protein